MKSFLFSSFFLLFSCIINAQVGIGTTSPSGALDVTSTTEGLLIPRVALVNTTTVTVLTATTSELVYNTATSGDVTPGFYYLSTNAGPWVRLATGSGTGWLITGNTGIVDGTHFIGTAALTNVDVAFRRNNLAAGKLSGTSTSFGVGALSAGATTNNAAFGNNALTLSTGADNVAVGTNALAANTTGATNTAVGRSALAANITATGNTGIGFTALTASTGGDNTAVGYQALTANTSGIQNTSLGVNALQRKTTGSANTAVGHSALNAVGTFSNATAVGFQSLLANTASNNTGIGFQALSANTSGSSNTAVGFQANASNITGSSNTAVGHSALGRNTGSSNTVMGYEAMFGAISSASDVTAIGWHALFNNSASESTAVGSFALQGIGSAAGNTAVGYRSLNNLSTGTNNTAVGNQAGFAATASNNTFIGYYAGQFSSGGFNTVVGSNALKANGASSNSVAIGYNSLAASTAANNTAVGYQSLITNSSGTTNVAIGGNALSGNTTGSGNVAIGYNAGSAETGSNKLYITNSATTATTSLIYGEFSPTRILRTNSIFQIGDPAGTGYVFPAARGTVSQVLQTDGAGVLTWVNPSALITETDPQVSSAATSSVPRWNGTTLVDGVVTDDGTNVGVGTAPSVGNKLDVAGKTRTTNFQMTNGAAANYILQSDAAGNGSWVQNPIAALSLVRVNLGGANQVLTTPGAPGTWEKINYSAEVFDTNSEFAGGTYTATKTGFFQINAGFHTNDQSNTQQYSIGVFVNGALYQETSGNHAGIGEVARSVNCMVSLAIGDTVEIYVKNYITGAEINNYSGKTFFEVQQIK